MYLNLYIPDTIPDYFLFSTNLVLPLIHIPSFIFSARLISLLLFIFDTDHVSLSYTTNGFTIVLYIFVGRVA